MILYVKDTTTGAIREVGKDQHDALWLYGGALHYRNLQNGEGTLGGGYKWCDRNGNTEFDNDEYDNYLPIDMTEPEERLIFEIRRLQQEFLLYMLGFKNKPLHQLTTQELTEIKQEIEKELNSR
jgi:hypothetical protein